MSNRNLMTPGQIIGGFEMVEKIGKGAFGEVYRVKKMGEPYAMKVEEIGEENVLYQEAKVLKALRGRVNYPMYVSDGAADGLLYLVMELVGKNLDDLKKLSKGLFTPSTWSRIGIQFLYAIKGLHDLGYLHRDIKPGNAAMGVGSKARTLQMLDFGMARRFIETDENGKIVYRVARPSAQFRGSRDFASLAAHQNKEQGRADDVWSLIYSVASFHRDLPWVASNDEELVHLKEVAHLQQLFGDFDKKGVLNSDLKEILDKLEKRLRAANYYTVPPYELIHAFFKKVGERVNAKWSDAFDWEKKSVIGGAPGPWENCGGFMKDGPLHHLRVPGAKQSNK